MTLLSGGARSHDVTAQRAARWMMNGWPRCCSLTSGGDRPRRWTRPSAQPGEELCAKAARGLTMRPSWRRHRPDCRQHRRCLRRFAPAPIGEAILAGGGARNPTLVRMLRERLHPTTVLLSEDIGLDSDNKEALLFALLAHETWHARPGTHPALTGARHGSILGQITPGRNYADLIRRTWCPD